MSTDAPNRNLPRVGRTLYRAITLLSPVTPPQIPLSELHDAVRSAIAKNAEALGARNSPPEEERS